MTGISVPVGVFMRFRKAALKPLFKTPYEPLVESPFKTTAMRDAPP